MYKFFFVLKSIIKILIILLFLQSLFFCSFDQAHMHIYTHTHIHKISGFFVLCVCPLLVLRHHLSISEAIYLETYLEPFNHLLTNFSYIYYLEQNIHFSPHYFSPIILSFSLDNYNNLTDVFVAYFFIKILS